MSKPTMRLLLLYARTDPEHAAPDWGAIGPTLEGIIAFHGTYQSTFNVYFVDEEAAKAAHAITGWPFWDEHALTMQFHDDMVETTQDGVKFYYADYEFQTVGGGE